MAGKNKNVLAGLTMSQSLDDQTQSDLDELKRKLIKWLWQFWVLTVPNMDMTTSTIYG